MRQAGSWLLLAIGAGALGACSTAGPAAPGLSIDRSMRWDYREQPAGEGHLAYGTPDTDNAGIIFSCRRKAGAVQFSTDLDKGKAGPGVVRLRSGKAKGQYVARLEVSELTDGWVASGRIALPDPVLSAFEQSGRISQVEDRVYPQDAETSAEQTDIKRFFGFCRG